MKEPKKTVSLLLPLPLHERLSQLAAESNRTLPAYIRQIIKSYLRELDRQQDPEDNWYPSRLLF